MVRGQAETLKVSSPGSPKSFLLWPESQWGSSHLPVVTQSFMQHSTPSTSRSYPEATETVKQVRGGIAVSMGRVTNG